MDFIAVAASTKDQKNPRERFMSLIARLNTVCFILVTLFAINLLSQGHPGPRSDAFTIWSFYTILSMSICFIFTGRFRLAIKFS